MDNKELAYLIDFAQRLGLQNKSVLEVYNKWNEELNRQ